MKRRTFLKMGIYIPAWIALLRYHQSVAKASVSHLGRTPEAVSLFTIQATSYGSGAYGQGPYGGQEPTAITLISFSAQAGADHITLTWVTGTEPDNAGFNLHRATAADGPYTKLNNALIPAEGDAVSGASYAYTDADVVKGVTYYYKLEDVDIHGVSTFHGPVSATSSAIRSIYLPTIVK